MKVMFFNDGELVEGELTIDGIPFDEFCQSPFYKAVAAAEWELIRQYDRGELT